MPSRHSVREYMKPSAWVLEPAPSTFGPTSRLSNKDMDPGPPKQRTWNTYNYVAYWISDATNAAVWELASSMLAVGLSWCVVPHSNNIILDSCIVWRSASMFLVAHMFYS